MRRLLLVFLGRDDLVVAIARRTERRRMARRGRRGRGRRLESRRLELRGLELRRLELQRRYLAHAAADRDRLVFAVLFAGEHAIELVAGLERRRERVPR